MKPWSSKIWLLLSLCSYHYCKWKHHWRSFWQSHQLQSQVGSKSSVEISESISLWGWFYYLRSMLSYSYVRKYRRCFPESWILKIDQHVIGLSPVLLECSATLEAEWHTSLLQIDFTKKCGLAFYSLSSSPWTRTHSLQKCLSKKIEKGQSWSTAHFQASAPPVLFGTVKVSSSSQLIKAER